LSAHGNENFRVGKRNAGGYEKNQLRGRVRGGIKKKGPVTKKKGGGKKGGKEMGKRKGVWGAEKGSKGGGNVKKEEKREGVEEKWRVRCAERGKARERRRGSRAVPEGMDEGTLT